MYQTVSAVSGHDEDPAPAPAGAGQERAIRALLFEIEMASQNLRIVKLMMTDPDAVLALEQRLDALQSRFEQLIRKIPPQT